MARAESGQEAHLRIRMGYKRGSPRTISGTTPHPTPIPCILICFPEWERVELLPACQEPRWVPHSQGRASHVSTSSTLCAQVRTAGFKAGRGRSREGRSKIGTWQAGFRVRREVRVAASQHSDCNPQPASVRWGTLLIFLSLSFLTC